MHSLRGRMRRRRRAASRSGRRAPDGKHRSTRSYSVCSQWLLHTLSISDPRVATGSCPPSSSLSLSSSSVRDDPMTYPSPRLLHRRRLLFRPSSPTISDVCPINDTLLYVGMFIHRALPTAVAARPFHAFLCHSLND